MPSFKNSVALVAGSLLLSVQAQQLYYPINITAVPLSTRTYWCQSQLTACPLLCLQNNGTTDSTTTANDCDPTTLDFDCVCGNGLSPNASEYSQTIPYFECQEYGNECVANCGGDTSCESDCRTQNPCGAQNPTRVNVTSTTSSTTGPTSGASASGSAVVFNGFGGASSTPTSGSSSSGSSSGSSSSKSGAQAAVEVGRSYGLAIVFTGLFAGFAMIL